jgi:hypothetical protein
MEQRRIPSGLVESVLENPQQIISEEGKLISVMVEFSYCELL